MTAKVKATLIDEGDLIHRVKGLSVRELDLCLTAGWILPAEAAGSVRRYHDIDVARLQLIHELREDLGIGDEAVSVVLSLIDQVHTLRREMTCLADTLSAQPEEIRRSVLAALADRLRR